MRRVTITRYHGMTSAPALACCAALAAVAAPAAAQKDVGEPLEHFLATKAVDGQVRSLDDPVARVVDDFNADGLVDVALWQARDLTGHGYGPVFLYIQRKDGGFAASGSVLADAATLFRVVPERDGGTRLLVCHAGAVARGYGVTGAIVSELPRRELPKACDTDPAPAVERLDVARYRATGMQAWIRR
jgi:hypothetical protein